MHFDGLEKWRHDHAFATGGEQGAERRTRIVLAVTIVMMVFEITAGTIFNSMALLADGWHMSTHAGALGIAAFAYWFARRHADDHRFSFGTGKVGMLGGFASAIILGVVALAMVWESVPRLLTVQTIAFDQAMVVAIIGLVVNLLSALILGGHDHHDHGHDHHGHDHHDHDDHHGHGDHHDHNLRAAYMHVLADAVTSVLAIIALFLGKHLGWWWMDPVMGLVGAVVVGKWAWGLLVTTGLTLLDHQGDDALKDEVRTAIESDADNRLADLHLWQVGPGHWAAIVSVVTHNPQPPDHYKTLLIPVHELSHITVEVLPCQGAPCTGRQAA